jgi:3-oxoacyl-[acyl-carrier protein] reductase
MNLQLNGKTALITGAGNGIGRETARRLAAEGVRVFSLDMDPAGNAETAAQVRAAGGVCEAVQGDVANAADVARAFRTAGPVDILINNAAAWAGDGVLHEVSEEAWDRVVAVTLKGVFLCTREALAGMMERRAGVIVNIASVNGLIGVHLAAYSAAKGGVVSLTRLLALQYGRYGIRVNAICPGTIMTESSRRHYDGHPDQEAELRALYPGKQFGEPADIAACALFLASAQARFFNGSVVVVDGGLTAGYRLPTLQGDE